MILKAFSNFAKSRVLALSTQAGLFVSLVLASTGCGKAPTHTEAVQVDPALSSYVSRFEQVSAQYGHPVQITDLTVEFANVNLPGETTVRGDCVTTEGKTPVINISADAWEASTDAEREQLIFHELGHCVLGLKHVAGVNADGIPESIMDPAEISSQIYSQNRDYYLNTLFAK